MHNIPDDCTGHPLAPWNEQEWHCPECGANEIDTDCEPGECRQGETDGE